MKTRYNIKARLAILGRTSKEVSDRINDMGIKCSPPIFSAAINGVQMPKCDKICEMADKIISEWEKEEAKE